MKPLMLAALLAALALPAHAAPPELHYAPEEQLDTIDAALIATAKTPRTTI
jgi:hypothetical protein